MAGQTASPTTYRNAVRLLAGGGALVGLYLAKLYNYLLFHTLVEMFSVIIACGIFVIAWNSRRIMDNGYFLFFGIASLFVGAVDFIHTLAYKGMGVFPGYGPNLPTQLWVVARYLQCGALLMAPLFVGRKLKAGLTALTFLAVTALLLAAVFNGVFPPCFVEGEGLTPFKKGSEYLFCLLLIGALVFMRRKMQAFDREVVRLISAGIAILIVSELAFTLYTDVYGISNMIGHFLKFIGFYFIYKALIEIGLARPYDLLFRELKLSEERYRDLYDERNEAARQIESLNSDLAARALDLQEANSEMEAANQELETANRELEIANQELEAFSFTVSHDLRSPLTNIHGCSQVLLGPWGDRVDSESRGLVKNIYDEAERMNQLIATLLNFSRLSRSEISRGMVDLSELAQAVAAQLRMSGPERRAMVAITDGLTADCDARLLRVVLENLLGNAWKYTARKEEARIEFGRVECGTRNSETGKPAFFVRDNGAGFDMAQAGRLFTPFHRLHNREEFEGHGIGLATVQRIIQRHGGRVWAESQPDNGATFYFTL
jgi:signal transduction histidine kinase